MANPKPIRLLILGTGGMAGNHAESFAAIPGVTLVAGVDTRPAQLTAFCDQHGIANRFDSLDAALAWGAFDAVTNVTPDAVHHPTTLPCCARPSTSFAKNPSPQTKATPPRWPKPPTAQALWPWST